MNVLEIFLFLHRKNLLKNAPNKYWWPHAGTFEVVVSAILTQNTTWSNVEKSLKNLDGYLELDRFADLDESDLKERIRPSGFYNQKAPRLLALARAIKKEFQSFETFTQRVSREWLLAQKGIGEESADAILCYAALRPVMVVDAYTKRTLASFGIAFGSYKEYQRFLQEGIWNYWDAIAPLCSNDATLCFARFHGMFVEYNKLQKKKMI